MKDFTYLPIRVKERNAPTIVFMLSSITEDREAVAYPSLGKTFEMYIKERAKDADPTPIAGERMMDRDTETEAAVGVDIPSSVLGEPKRLFYHLDAVSPRETVAWGPLIILDI
jgi:hypothetical protein